MTKYETVNIFYATFQRVFLLICGLLFLTNSYADDCPQRYRDIVFNQVKVNKNISYGGRKVNTDGTRTWLVMDIYEPKDDTAQLRPLAMLIHGGGFTNFPPLFRATPDIVEMARSLARRGYVVVSPEYRLFSGDNSFDKLAETAFAGLVDIFQAACFLVHTVENGNPYRIDTSRFFIGGSSAGAFLSLNTTFIRDTSDVPAAHLPAMRRVAALDQVNMQDILEYNFCGMWPRVVVPISGGVFDTAYVKPFGGKVLLIHGMTDTTIPGGVGFFYRNPSFPETFGSEVLANVFSRLDIPFAADFYPDEGHVPIILDFNRNLWDAVLQTILTGTAANVPVMDSTQRHMARLFYEAIGSPVTACPTPTNIPDFVAAGQLQVVPNPSGGIFQVEIPAELRGKEVRVQVFNMTGQSVYNRSGQATNLVKVDISGQNAGLYILSLYIEGADGTKIYVDKVVKQ